jgi:hydrogenase nickel incorporation protein HypB
MANITTITIGEHMLAANERTAEEVRQRLAAHHLPALNLMSSPGAGKTTLLERTISCLRGQIPIGVIEGDIETSADAERITQAGARAIQINTRGACHLEAGMVAAALDHLTLTEIKLLVIENIGNLVCPAAWDLGEAQRGVLVSTTEGDDKPAKYPRIVASAHVLVINKLDLLPYVDFDVAKVRRHALAVNPRLRIFEVSCRTGEGLDAWCAWLTEVISGVSDANVSSVSGT